MAGKLQLVVCENVDQHGPRNYDVVDILGVWYFVIKMVSPTGRVFPYPEHWHTEIYLEEAREIELTTGKCKECLEQRVTQQGN